MRCWRAANPMREASPFPPKTSPPPVLLAYQQKSIASAHAHAVTVIEKSRRIGLTWGFGSDAVLVASSGKTSDGMDVFYVGYNLDMAREFIDTCAMWARAFHLALVGSMEEMMFEDGPDRAIAAFRIKFASGFEILALASRPRSLRGRQGLVIIDEAAFHDDLPGLLQSALALLIWGGRVVVISTHLGVENPFNLLVEDVRGGRRPYNLIRIDFDEALADGLYQRICLVAGKPWSPEAERAWRAEIVAFYGPSADEELFCIPAASAGTFLPLPLIESARSDCPVIRLAKPNDFTHWPRHLREAEIDHWLAHEVLPVLATCDKALVHHVGGDYARTRDLTVIWVLATLRTQVRRSVLVIELRNLPFDAQARIQRAVIAALPRFGSAMLDATGLGAALAEDAAQAFGAARIVEVKLSVEWYRDHMQPLKTAFEDGSILIPTDADIAADLHLITVTRGVPMIPALRSGAKADRHGDAAVALALAYAASQTGIMLYDYTTMADAGRGDRAMRDLQDDMPQQRWPQGGRGLW